MWHNQQTQMATRTTDATVGNKRDHLNDMRTG